MWGPGAVLFSCFLFAACWAPCAGAGPPPPPWRKPEGKSEAATSAESGGLGTEWERTAVRGSRTPGISISTSPAPITRKPRLLGQDHSCPCHALQRPGPQTSWKHHRERPQPCQPLLPRMEGNDHRDVLTQSLTCFPSRQPVSPPSCLTSFPLAARPVPGSEEIRLTLPSHAPWSPSWPTGAAVYLDQESTSLGLPWWHSV